MSIFKDQAIFMRACGQTVGEFDLDQFNLYLKLLQEEITELQTALGQQDKVQTLDALLDIIVVSVGAVHSIGARGEEAWQAVVDSNMAKIDPDTGEVRRRADGKIMKPEGWQPPNLADFFGA